MNTTESTTIEKISVMSLTSGNTYDIEIHPDGTWTCSCPHWLFRCRGTGKDCKHIIAEKKKRGLIKDPQQTL